MNRKYKILTSLLLSIILIILTPITIFANENNSLNFQNTDISINNSTIIENPITIDENLLTSSEEKSFSIDIIEPEAKQRTTSGGAIEITPKKSTLILVKVNYSYNSKTKQFDFSFNIDAPTTLVKPKISKATITIKKASSKNGTYTTVGTSSSWNNISYITNYKKSISATTGHYKVQVNITPAKGYSINLSGNSVYWCINRTGHIWVWNYTDQLSGKSISEPTTNWAKQSLHTRPSNLNKTYKTWYDQRYNTNLNLSNYDVHHIRPLAYGGNNTTGNLIHLDKTFHKGVTAWFAGY